MQEAKEQGLVRDGQIFAEKPQFLSPSTLSGIKKKTSDKRRPFALGYFYGRGNDEPNVIA